MTPSLSASDAELAPAERLHPLYLVTGLGKALKGAWGLIAGAAVLGSQGRWWLVALIAVAFVIFSVGSLFFTWLKLEYRVGTDELRIDSGLLSRNSRAIPFDRVVQLHVSGHTTHGTHTVDTHIGPVIDPVWELLGEAHRRTGASILLEWDAEIPSFEETHADALRAKDFIGAPS